jgi:hypothetical protein
MSTSLTVDELTNTVIVSQADATTVEVVSRGPQGIPGAGGALGYYGSFYDTTDQPLIDPAQAQTIRINTTAEASGISIVAGDSIYFENAGVYSLTFSIQFTNRDNVQHATDVWLRKNGSDVADTNSRFDVPARKSQQVPGHHIGTINYVLSVDDGDYLQLVWADGSTLLSIESLDAGTNPAKPATPGIILTVAQVMYTLINQEMPRAITVGNPQVGENLTLLYTQREVVVDKIVSQVAGQDSPSMRFSVRHGADRSGAGTEIVTGGILCSNTTTGLVTTVFNAAVIPQNHWLWLTTSDKTGLVSQISVTLHFA